LERDVDGGAGRSIIKRFAAVPENHRREAGDPNVSIDSA
jgi:hypothetical protein